MTASITVISIKHLDGDGPTKAFCDVAIGGVKVCGVRVIVSDKGPFVGMPSTKGKDGKWRPVVELSKPLAEKVRAIVLSAWRGEAAAGDDGSSRQIGQSDPSASPGAPDGRRNGKPDPRQDRIDELARAFDQRPPDEVPF